MKECRFNANLNLQIADDKEIDILLNNLGTRVDSLSISLIDALVLTWLSPSRSMAKKDIKSGIIYVCEYVVNDINYMFSDDDIYRDRFLFIRRTEKQPRFLYVVLYPY